MADPAPGLADEEVRERIGDLDRLLASLEKASGPVAGAAVAAVSALTEVYGAALARVTALAARDQALLASLTADEVVSSLLVLHGLHPEPPATRAARALAQLRPQLQAQGGDAELLGVDGDAARIRLSGSCQGCASQAAALQRAVADAVLTAAPELTRVEPAASPQGPELIPAGSLLRKPAGAGGTGDARRPAPVTADPAREGPPRAPVTASPPGEGPP